jgi:hypothetical protein
MRIFKTKFPELVVKEARKLRKLTTELEKSRLDFSNLDPLDSERCIYGQITGHCFSARAKELIEKSCVRVYNKGSNLSDTISSSKLNGSPIGKHRDTNIPLWGSTSYFSPIEVFIVKAKDNVVLLERLVSYIKGERRTLNL